MPKQPKGEESGNAKSSNGHCHGQGCDRASDANEGSRGSPNGKLEHPKQSRSAARHAWVVG